MKISARSKTARPLSRFNNSTIQHVCILCALFFFANARAQFSPPGTDSARSISGQFIIVGSLENSPLANSRLIATNADFVRLEPALLVVSAERLKKSLWRDLAINSTPWRGQIFLTLHPAQSLDEEVTIVSKPSKGGWNYLVRLPDILPRARFTRAMTGVLMLEFANRNAQLHLAEIPAWLTDGLSQKFLAVGSPEIILSMPDKIVNGLPLTQINASQRGLDPLADARRVLKNFPALTFAELSWPTDTQLSGADGGVYRASAQLFVSELLDLKGGAAKLRTMLETAPQYYNWQTAFEDAFRENFPRALDVEKWWALQVVDFAARDRGAQWTSAASRKKLDEILSVPVEMRTASNALPVHAEISIQSAIRNFDQDRQITILQVKLRDLELAEFQVATPLAALTGAYRRVLADYLGEDKKTANTYTVAKHPQVASQKTSARDTLKKLDQLDARRRAVESTIQPDNSLQPSLAPIKF
jgi:hypothetical protein